MSGIVIERMLLESRDQFQESLKRKSYKLFPHKIIIPLRGMSTIPFISNRIIILFKRNNLFIAHGSIAIKVHPFKNFQVKIIEEDSAGGLIYRMTMRM